MSDFVKELNFDGDTFNDMKRDMNFVLQRLLGNMQEKECQEGTLTLKLDVSLMREYVPNYNPNIPGESREIAKPKFSHKVTSQMKVEDMKKGNLDTEMELFLNEETGEYEMRPVADTTQRKDGRRKLLERKYMDDHWTDYERLLNPEEEEKEKAEKLIANAKREVEESLIKSLEQNLKENLAKDTIERMNIPEVLKKLSSMGTKQVTGTSLPE